MKRIGLMFLVSFTLLFVGFSLLAQSPAVPSATPTVIVPAPVASGGFMQQVGGLAGAVSFIVFGLFTLLTAIRAIVAKYDGVAPGQNTPAPDAKLTFLNTACLALGKVIDFLTGNYQH